MPKAIDVQLCLCITFLLIEFAGRSRNPLARQPELAARMALFLVEHVQNNGREMIPMRQERDQLTH